MSGYGYSIEPMAEADRARFIQSLDHLRNTSRTRCLVCHVDLTSSDSGAEEHHVWPRSYGGTHLPTVMLCPSHHTYTHTLARRVITQLSKGKPAPQLRIETDGNIQTVLSLVKTIVIAWANPMVIDKRMQIIVEEELLPDFFLIKETFGCSDKSVIAHAIKLAADVLRHR